MRCFVDDDGQIFWQCGMCGDILTWRQWVGVDGPSAAAEEAPPSAAAATSSVGASSGVQLQSEEERAVRMLAEIKVAYICALCEVLGIVPEDEGMTAWTDQQISTTIQQLKQRLAARSDTA